MSSSLVLGSFGLPLPMDRTYLTMPVAINFVRRCPSASALEQEHRDSRLQFDTLMQQQIHPTIRKLGQSTHNGFTTRLASYRVRDGRRIHNTSFFEPPQDWCRQPLLYGTLGDKDIEMIPASNDQARFKTREQDPNSYSRQELVLLNAVFEKLDKPGRLKLNGVAV
ncbi:MAG: hypothetical protein OXU45_05035 [Candidatus Melainabacteria bacterium]|nr:hypothetical protein [Candidatus Melainabacteria bacterium]